LLEEINLLGLRALGAPGKRESTERALEIKEKKKRKEYRIG